MHARMCALFDPHEDVRTAVFGKNTFLERCIDKMKILRYLKYKYTYIKTKTKNKAAKMILDEHPRSSATDALKRLNWTTLATRRHNHRCIFVYKCINELINFKFNLIKNENVHNYNTRRSNNLHLPRANTNKGKQRPTYQKSIDFNNLDQRTKNAITLKNFKACLKRNSK